MFEIVSISDFEIPTYKGNHKILEAIDSEIGILLPLLYSIVFKDG